ncbi:SseB family protein, partial [Streptomyces sp. MS2A]|nr:SseB family protein [Streptomyces sp. MS2A]
LAAPREADSEAKVGEALATARFWVAVSAPGEDGQFGVAEARAADGSRFLQVFSHPLEVVALARGDQPMPFSGEQIGKVLAGHPELTGVIVDPAGPTIAVRRDALGAVLALAEAPAAD